MKFIRCLKFVLEKEGGFVNHRDDPGGATNMGITIGTYSRWIGRQATVSEIENLSIDTAVAIYEKYYWQEMNCYWLPVGIDLVLFDMGVNAGTVTAAKLLQKEIGGLVVDGIVGQNTIAAANRYTHNRLLELIGLYTDARVCYYKNLDHFEVFGRGWTTRARSASEKAKEMVEQYG